MQCMNGDHQHLCGRVKRQGGVTFLIGDRNQARIAPVQGLEPAHIANLELAFPGGPFHRHLNDPSRRAERQWSKPQRPSSLKGVRLLKKASKVRMT
eukprot:14379503-Heterocapsa_arctica.AAC.1